MSGLFLRQIAWGRAKEMLDRGLALHELIGEETAPETLHALKDELPSYLRTRGYAPEART